MPRGNSKRASLKIHFFAKKAGGVSPKRRITVFVIDNFITSQRIKYIYFIRYELLTHVTHHTQKQG
ncbi:MAG: hypothetical protein LBP59_08940 [Planctomycetaceae bacterium]|nr:hypothetical protein [Planctomycetaceae bacterium]